MSATHRIQTTTTAGNLQHSSGITENDIAFAICKYFLEVKKITNKNSKETLGIAYNTASSYVKKDDSSHHPGTLNKIVEAAGKYLDSHTAFNKEFDQIVSGYLRDEGFNYDICYDQLSGDGLLADRVSNLLLEYNQRSGPLSYLSVDSIIVRLRSLCQNYPAFFAPSKQARLYLPKVEGFNSDFLVREICSGKKQNNVVSKNYLVLTFPMNYRVMILLCEDFGRNSEAKNLFLQQLKKMNSISMFIIFTDKDVSREEQKELMKHFNIFFEHIQERDFSEVALKNVSFHEYSLGADFLKNLFYAQVIMDRLITYFSIIRTEVVYHNYPGNCMETDFKELSQPDYYLDFADKIVVKKIYNYSYNTRQAIRFERKLILDRVQKLAATRPDGKLDLIVELCAPNALLTASVHSYCRKMMLFSSSQTAIRRFNGMKFQNLKACQKQADLKESPGNPSVNDRDNRIKQKIKSTVPEIFPQHVHFFQTHPDSEFITKNYFSKGMDDVDSSKKADVVVLGMGMASSISNLRNLLRSVNLWLKDDGIVILSFINQESVLLSKDVSDFGGFERKPLFFSSLWQFELADGKKFLNRTTPYDANTIRWIMDDYTKEVDFYSFPDFLTMAPMDTEHSRLHELGVLDMNKSLKEHNAVFSGQDENTSGETGQIQKKRSLKGAYSGHYLYMVGSKKPVSGKREQCLGVINEFLDFKLHGKFQRYPHTYAENSMELYNTLRASGIDMNKHLLLKTIVLREGNEIIYCIVPYNSDSTLNFEATGYRLCRSRFVNEYFGPGSISPLVVFADSVLPSHKTCVFCINLKQNPEINVIMPGGKNTEAIIMSKNNFMDCLPDNTQIVSPEQLFKKLSKKKH